MKITKSELSQIIKEEAERFMKIQNLKKREEELKQHLQEMYDMEEGAFGKAVVSSTSEKEEEEVEEGFASALSKLAGKVQKAGAGAIVSDEKKAEGKKLFDEKLAKLKSELQAKGYTDDKIVTVDANGTKTNGLNEKALIDAAEQNAYQGMLNFGASRATGQVIVSFVEGSLTGASPAGPKVFEEEVEEEMEEGFGSALSKLAGKVQKAGAGAIVSDEKKAEGKKLFDEKMAKLKSELQAKGYTDDKIVTVDANGAKTNGLNEKALIDAAEQNAYQGKLNYGVSKATGQVVVSFAEGALTGATTGGHQVFEENLSESYIRKIVREESDKNEKIKELLKQAESLKEKMNKLK
jgi:hypothetical protein